MTKQSNKLETWGSDVSMNMNPVVYQNILASLYFKTLYDKKTYHEVIDEIYNKVNNLEPFLKDTTPSTAFCLLYKLWTLKLTIKQVEGLIDHGDSPFIRGIGFLYLRFVCTPAKLWDWFEGYLEDDEEIQISGGVRPVTITIGRLCRDLLTDQKFLGTMLPRIPVPIARDITQKLQEYDSLKYAPPPPHPAPVRRGSPSYDLDPRAPPGPDHDQHRRSGSREGSAARSSSGRYGDRERDHVGSRGGRSHSQSRSPKRREDRERERRRYDKHDDYDDRRRGYNEKDRERGRRGRRFEDEREKGSRERDDSGKKRRDITPPRAGGSRRFEDEFESYERMKEKEKERERDRDRRRRDDDGDRDRRRRDEEEDYERKKRRSKSRSRERRSRQGEKESRRKRDRSQSGERKEEKGRNGGKEREGKERESKEREGKEREATKEEDAKAEPMEVDGDIDGEKGREEGREEGEVKE